MAWRKVYFLYVPSKRCCNGSILKIATLVMLVKSSLRSRRQSGPFEPATQLRPENNIVL